MRLGYSYDSWIAEKITEGSILPEFSGKYDDPDGDKIINFMEYLAFSDPGTAATSRPSLLEVTQIPTGLTLTFDRNNEVIDVDYELQGTIDLSDPNMWSAIAIPPEGTLPFVTQERIEVQVPLSPGASSGFFRLMYAFPGTP
jgi:hypothetical protein